MTDRSTGRYYLLKLIFPLIYAGFFVVQLFINFDTAFTQFSDRYQIIQCRDHSDHPVALEKSRGSQPVKTKFRLNKRFQPAVITTLADTHCAPSICFINIRRIRCVDPFITNPMLDTRLLRGPPFID
jgi:hypothetical protein